MSHAQKKSPTVSSKIQLLDLSHALLRPALAIPEHQRGKLLPAARQELDRLAPRTLILTESALYLCDEDYAVEWPEGSPPFRVLRSALFVDVVELVLKEHQLDFTLVVSTVFGIVRRNKRWRFRAQNRQVKDMVVREIRRQMET